MKKFLKKYGVSILIVLGLIAWFAVRANKYVTDQKTIHNMQVDYYEMHCGQDQNSEKCKQITKPEPMKIDSFGTMVYTIYTSDCSSYILFLVVLIAIPGTYRFFKEFRSGYTKNIIMRISYRSYLKQKMREGLKKIVWILPVMLLGCFAVSYILCDGVIDLNLTYEQIQLGISYPPLEYMKYPILFSLVYIINLVLLSIFCFNISFICVKKAKNFILCILMSLLIYYLFNIIMNLGIATILLRMVLGIKNIYYYFDIWNLNTYVAPPAGATTWGLLYMHLFTLIITIGSFIAVYFSYHNKEKVMMEIEK